MCAEQLCSKLCFRELCSFFLCSVSSTFTWLEFTVNGSNRVRDVSDLGCPSHLTAVTFLQLFYEAVNSWETLTIMCQGARQRGKHITFLQQKLSSMRTQVERARGICRNPGHLDFPFPLIAQQILWLSHSEPSFN